jgi:hypothetical protein
MLEGTTGAFPFRRDRGSRFEVLVRARSPISVELSFGFSAPRVNRATREFIWKRKGSASENGLRTAESEKIKGSFGRVIEAAP